MTFVYDAAVLIAADRGDRRTWADHRARLERGMRLATTAPVVAQVSRSERQVPLRRFLAGCAIVPFAASEGHETGELVAASGVADVVDAHVVLVAAARSASVLTSDVDDLSLLAEAAAKRVPVLPA